MPRNECRRLSGVCFDTCHVALQSDALSLLVLPFASANAVYAQAAFEFAYGGRVVTNNGKPVDGPVALKVTFYHDANGQTPILTITDGLQNAALQQGIFQIRLMMSATDYNQVFSDTATPVWIQITHLTHYPTAPFPLQQLEMTPYAAKIPVDNTSVSFTSDGRMPLMGNPTAAVLYPGKLVFALVRYPLAARLYIMGHTLLAFAAMLALLRRWGTSWVGSTLGAWPTPSAGRSCSSTATSSTSSARPGCRWASARSTAGCGSGGGSPWPSWRSCSRWRPSAATPNRPTSPASAPRAMPSPWPGAGGRGRAARRPARRRRCVAAGPSSASPCSLTLWVVGDARRGALAAGLPAGRDRRASRGPVALDPLGRPGGRGRLGPGRAGAAGALADGGEAAGDAAGPGADAGRARRGGGRWRPASSAAQLLPVLEFTGQSSRAAGDGPHDIYPFSLHPVRVVEFALAQRLRHPVPRQPALARRPCPRRGRTLKVWVPTLYLGGLTLVLALGGLRLGEVRRRARPLAGLDGGRRGRRPARQLRRVRLSALAGADGPGGRRRHRPARPPATSPRSAPTVTSATATAASTGSSPPACPGSASSGSPASC